MPASDATTRFADRVADYVRYRPGYPPGVLEVLRREGALGPGAVVADVGSGPGLSAAPFLDAGPRVFGVEPNPAMRAAAEDLLAARSTFQSVGGRAEATTLPAVSVDLVVAG